MDGGSKPVLAAGVVDGRKWKGAEVAREYKLPRARICVVLKEVERKLAEAVARPGNTRNKKGP